ncbi:MAG: site-2 protease family protein [Clostridia bacterium]|nr:site-2 protease family protein [Clostridia bacterium]
MLTNILYILLAIVMLGIIVTVHEFGHYLVGRLCGIGIVEFSVGFGPRLLGWKRKGIQYSLRAIPLGGYCAFVGEDERNDDPRAMNNQPVWKRFLTVLAGPFMNFVLAFVTCTAMLALFTVAESFPAVENLSPDMPAVAAGVEKGDVIVQVNGDDIEYGGAGVAQIVRAIQGVEPGSTVKLVVERDGQRIPLEMQTAAVTTENGVTHGMIGIEFSRRTFTVPEALRYAGAYMVGTTKTMLDSLRRLFFHGEGVGQITGTVGVIAVVSQYARDGWYEVLWLMFVISLNLGIMNLLPLPALDGGRLVFLIVEAIRRKPIPPEKEGMVHGIGLVLVLGLFVLLTFHDIYRLILGGVNGLLQLS